MRRFAPLFVWLLLSVGLISALFALRRSPQQAATVSSNSRSTPSETTPTLMPKPTFTVPPTASSTMVPTATRRTIAKSNFTKTPQFELHAIITARGLNVRAGPGIRYERLGALGKETELILDGRDQSGNWVHGRAKQEDLEGWLSTGYMAIEGDPATLPVIRGDVVNRSRPSATPRSHPTKTRPPATQKPVGIGVTRNEIQTLFERLGLRFERLDPIKGQPNIRGQSEDSLVMVQLIGPPDDLVSASVATFVSSTQPEKMVESAGYLIVFLNKAAPDWEEGSSWIGKNIPTARREIEGAKITVGDREIILQVIEEGDAGLITLTVQSTGW